MASGYVIEVPAVDFSGKSANIDHWQDPDYNWRAGLWQVFGPFATLTSPVQFTDPTKMAHWQVGGVAAADPVEEAWGSCTELLMRL